MAKNYYAVKRGFDKENNKEIKDFIFDSWIDVKPLVIGYENARYKGFDTKEEAEVWLSVVDKKDAEKRAKDKVDRIKEDIGIVTISNDPISLLALEYKRAGYSREEAIANIIEGSIEIINQVYKSL